MIKLYYYHPLTLNENQYLRIAKVNRLFISEVQGITDGVHIAEYRGVENAGIAFGHFDAGMTEHLRYVFQTYALREAEGGVSMTGGVHRQVLVNLAYLGYFFQIAIHHLIAGYRKQNTFLGRFLVALIFLNNSEGYIKQWNVGHKPNIRCMDLGKSVKFAV